MKLSSLAFSLQQYQNRKALITKPAETDFEQSLLTIFDCRKATNCVQSLYY